MYKRAQGTTEYLVILAVIVVIALVVVTLLITSGDQASTVSEEQSRLYWRAQPISIVESSVDSEGDGVISLRSQEEGVITYLEIDGLQYDVNGSYGAEVSVGDEIVIFFTGLNPCLGGTGVYEVKIIYLTPYGLEKTIAGTIALVINCGSDIEEETILNPNYVLAGYHYGQVRLLTPVDNTTVTNPLVDFTYNTNGENLSECFLMVGGSAKAKDSSSPFDTFQYTLPAEDTYDWDVICTFQDTNISSLDGPWQIIYGAAPPVDSDPPVFNLSTPTDPTTDTDGTVSFVFTSPVDASNVSSCELLINGVSKVTNNGGPYGTFTDYVFSSDGVYEWDVNCTDEHGNEGSSGNGHWNIIIDTAPALFAGGTGTLADPYQIEDCEDLNNMGLFIDANYVLISNIDCDVAPFDSGDDFNPVGTFTGSFDGAGYTISELYINRPGQSNVGLFGFVDGGSITNAALIDVNIIGGSATGGLVGRKSTVSGTIADSYVTGNVKGTSKVGGFVGYFVGSGYNGKIQTSYFEGNVSGSSSHVGGFVGELFAGVIDDCYSNANVVGTSRVGGFGGYEQNGGHLRSYSIGTVEGTGDEIGGFFGRSWNFSVSNSFSTSDINAPGPSTSVGGFIGAMSSCGVLGNNYWFNDESVCCGVCCGGSCTKASAVSDFYDVSYGIYTVGSWNFTTVWDDVCDDVGYPPLQWENITDTADCVGEDVPQDYPEPIAQFVIKAEPGATGTDNATDVFVDDEGNIYNVGGAVSSLDFGTVSFTNDGSFDFFVTKHDSSGNLLWAKSSENGSGGGADYANGVVVDSSGNVYVAGYTSSNLDFGNGKVLTIDGGTDFFLVKYNSGGVAQWVGESISGSGNSTDQVRGVALDGSGNVFISGLTASALNVGNGQTITNDGQQDPFIVKYNSSGVAQWIRTCTTCATQSWSQSVAADSSGNSYMVGWTNGDMDFGVDAITNDGGYEFFLVKYDPNGNPQWVKSPENGSGTGGDQAEAVAADSSGNVYVAGYANSSLDFGNGKTMTYEAFNDFFVVKYNSSGVAQWVGESYDLTNSQGEPTRAVDVDTFGNVYVCGSTGESDGLDFGNGVITTSRGIFITKYNSSGVAQWAKDLGSYSGCLDVYATNGDRLYVAGAQGWDDATLDFGNGVTSTNRNSFFSVVYD